MHILCDNCNAYAERNVLFFPLLKWGMWRLIDVRLILLLFFGINVDPCPLKVVSINWVIIETAMFFITTEQAYRLRSSS